MTPMSYREQDFEDHIEEHLLKTGYRKRNPQEYDRELCLIPDDLIGFIKKSQPAEYNNLTEQYGSDTDKKLSHRLSGEIYKRGSLDVLRNGIKDRGVSFKLVFFKPESGMNPEALELYNKNIFTVVRQLKYSAKNKNSIDIVLFINGIPITTAELKNSLTGQNVEHAKKQYEYDRNPMEKLLSYKRCLVHFAVGNERIHMTTKLEGHMTKFLPFNKDTINPVNPVGHKTAYLWDDIWQKDTLLNLIGNYICIQKKTEKLFDNNKGLYDKEDEVFIFPRYHQLDAVRKVLTQVREDGIGGKYLIQHSAGSGKSNSIAWLAHHLASFFQKPDDKERLFDSIIVVTDRRVLDKQLRNTIKQFEQTAGVVIGIDRNSAQLKESLEKGKSIIVTTLQKFPVISKNMSDLKGSRFAVIIDEAHSSQSGESAKHLKTSLSANLENAEKEDQTELDLEDKIVKEIESRGPQKHISYFAFTATPKNKTLELFGSSTDEGNFIPFHLYSMRQAIEEGFIRDVLENYTTYNRYFKLIKTVENDEKFEKRKAIRLLTYHVDLKPHAIKLKSEIVLEHFTDKTDREIQGKGRAMFITRSRLHAVKYYLEFQRQMKERGLKYKPLVAFSGEVVDPDTGEKYKENRLNGLPPRTGIPDAFKTPEYKMLVVANKFQTGYDEPLLHTMYVDKKLAGVQAVQALSRLNRRMDGKDGTMVLDFVNDPEAIYESFQPYYETVYLEEETDPNILYDQRRELEEYEIFAKDDVEEHAEVFFGDDPGEKLQPILDRVVIEFVSREEEERESFRGLLQKHIRLYRFVSQLITFTDVDLEKLYVFAKNLNRKLPKRDNKLPYEIKDAVDLESFRIQKKWKGKIELEKEDHALKGFGDGSHGVLEDEKELLSVIVEKINELHGIDLTEEHKLDVMIVVKKLKANEQLKAINNPNNDPEDIKREFFKAVDDELKKFIDTKLDLYRKLSDQKVNHTFKSTLYELYRDGFQST